MRKIFLGFLPVLIAVSCTSSQISLNDLQGTWAPSKDENATFTIKGNTIQYFEEEGYFDLSLSKDVITLTEEGHHITYYKILKANRDSLVLVTDEKKN